MPKCYSERERAYIRQRLKEEAGKWIAQYGIRRTTVDEIVKRVKIPKGTFYLFYQSKELLLFEAILEQHDLIERKLYESVSGIDLSAVTADQLTDIIFGFFKMSAEMPVLKVLNSDEIELLARKLPQEVLEQHLGDDNAMTEKVLSLLPVKPGVDFQVFTAAFRSLYFSTLHREEIGEENYDEALRLLIYGLVTQLI